MFVALRRMALSLLALGALLGAPAQAGNNIVDIRIHGATTVVFGLVAPQKSRIEQLASVKLAILPSSTGHGLEDLAQGRTDIAMLAESLATAAAALNKKQPGLI